MQRRKAMAGREAQESVVNDSQSRSALPMGSAGPEDQGRSNVRALEAGTAMAWGLGFGQGGTPEQTPLSQPPSSPCSHHHLQ